MYNEARNRASQKYQNAHLEQIRIWVKKGFKDKYKAYAQKQGKSLTALIIELLEADMLKNGEK